MRLLPNSIRGGIRSHNRLGPSEPAPGLSDGRGDSAATIIRSSQGQPYVPLRLGKWLYVTVSILLLSILALRHEAPFNSHPPVRPKGSRAVGFTERQPGVRLYRRHIALGCVAALAVGNLGYLGLNGNHWLLTALSFGILLTFPGVMIAVLLQIRGLEWPEYLPYIVGFSLSYLLGLGLILNWILPLLGVTAPLSPFWIVTSVDGTLFIAAIMAVYRSRELACGLTFPNLRRLDLLMIALPCGFPVLSVFGAVDLNNGGPADLSMLTLGAIGLYSAFLMLLGSRRRAYSYPYALVMMALSLLLMTSLRGWYTTGHDVQREFYLFEYTKQNLRWTLPVIPDAYSACLSITILPTMLQALLHVEDVYVYKVLFQAIYAVAILASFSLWKLFVDDTIAFLSALSLMSFPTFINDLPMLNRQEIALLFFALMLLATFSRGLQSRTRTGLVIVFGCSMMVAHYSTAYVGIALFTGVWVLRVLASRIAPVVAAPVVGGPVAHYLGSQLGTGRIGRTAVVLLVGFLYLWNFPITNSGAGLVDTINGAVSKIDQGLSTQDRSSSVLYSLLSTNAMNREVALRAYAEESVDRTRRNANPRDFYDDKDYSGYRITAINNEVLPLTPLGRFVVSSGLDVRGIISSARQGAARLSQVLVVLGIAGMLGLGTRLRSSDHEYLLLAVVGTGLLVLAVILPQVSADYGLLRLFQQNLTILAMPATIGWLTASRPFGRRAARILMASGVMVLFLLMSGFLPQLFGGYVPQLNLNASGTYYDAYYTHKAEVDAATWLAAHRDKKVSVQCNMFAAAKILSYAGLPSYVGLLPGAINRNSYVYLDYYNTTKKADLAYFEGDVIAYSYPVQFLEENKNRVYDNGYSMIFK